MHSPGLPSTEPFRYWNVSKSFLSDGTVLNIGKVSGMFHYRMLSDPFLALCSSAEDPAPC